MKGYERRRMHGAPLLSDNGDPTMGLFVAAVSHGLVTVTENAERTRE
jgi:hypothetical protein